MTHFCLQCDNGTELIFKKQDLIVSYRDKSTVVPEVEGWHCPVCHECEFADKADSRRHIDALNSLVTTVKEEEQAFIRNVRKKLGLKQAEAGKLFGGGINAFSEYERGITQPHKSTIALLRILNSHPELLKEVQPM